MYNRQEFAQFAGAHKRGHHPFMQSIFMCYHVQNWKILEKYNSEKPFFLSGGLGLHNLKKIKQINHPQLVGFDFNSRLEDENYKKITEEVNELIQKIRTK